MTKYGQPSPSRPASITRAMPGWFMRASDCRSASKRASDLVAVEPELDDLERDLPHERHALLGQVHDAHPALAERAGQVERADVPSHERGRARAQGRDRLRVLGH